MSIIEKSKFYQRFKKTEAQVIELEKRIAELENKLNNSSEIKCPSCGAYQYFVIGTKPHKNKSLSIMGVKIISYKCKKCDFEDEDTFHPKTH